MQRDQSGQVLGVGEPAGPRSAAEPVRDRGRDPAQHDVLELPAPGAVLLGREEHDVLPRLEPRPRGERRAERPGLAFARGLVIRHNHLNLTYDAILIAHAINAVNMSGARQPPWD